MTINIHVLALATASDTAAQDRDVLQLITKLRESNDVLGGRAYFRQDAARGGARPAARWLITAETKDETATNGAKASNPAELIEPLREFLRVNYPESESDDLLLSAVMNDTGRRVQADAANGLLVGVTDVGEALSVERFESFYDQVHAQEALDSGIYDSVRRMRRRPDDGSSGPEFLALYDSVTPGVEALTKLMTPEFKPKTPLIDGFIVRAVWALDRHTTW